MREPVIRDNDLVIEAPTAEAALAMVAERLGTRARISGVERIRRGGIGGFFTREVVQVTATVTDDTPAAAPSAGSGGDNDTVRLPRIPPPSDRAAVDVLLDRVDESDDERSFEQVLSRHLAATEAPDHGRSATPPPGPSDVSTAPDVATTSDARTPDVQPTTSARVDPRPAGRTTAETASITDPDPDPHADAGARNTSERMPLWTPTDPDWSEPGTPRWGLANLRRLGLTDVLRRTDVEGLDPNDDSGWTHALATRLMPLVRPLPPGPSVIVGPSAARLASVTGMPRCDVGADRTPESFVAAIGDSDEERGWLASARRGRTLHLVVGDRRWRRLLFDEPAVLSWTAGELCEALSLAAAFDLALGYAIPDIGTAMRPTAVDLAVAVRGMLPTRPAPDGVR